MKKEGAGGGGGMDPFASFFGDFGFGFGNGNQGQREVAKGADIVMDLYVTLEELYSGNFVEVSLNYYYYRLSIRSFNFFFFRLPITSLS